MAKAFSGAMGVVPALDIDSHEQFEFVVKSTTKVGGVVGYKLGLTSAPMQQMLGVDSPDFAPVLATHVNADGADIAVAEFIWPRVEAEIALVLREDLSGPDCTEEDAARAAARTPPAEVLFGNTFFNTFFNRPGITLDQPQARADGQHGKIEIGDQAFGRREHELRGGEIHTHVFVHHAQRHQPCAAVQRRAAGQQQRADRAGRAAQQTDAAVHGLMAFSGARRKQGMAHGAILLNSRLK